MYRTSLRMTLVLVLVGACTLARAEDKTVHVTLRDRALSDEGNLSVRHRSQEWDARKTAVIVCDMWDRHWCKGATDRVAEMAPAINRLIAVARGQGALVIHAPSGVTGYYQGHRGRSIAQKAPDAADLPAEIGTWNSWISEREEAAYPIDQSDGGEDDERNKNDQQ